MKTSLAPVKSSSSLSSYKAPKAPKASASGKNPAAWSGTSTNHRDARQLIMARVMDYMGKGDVHARRASEGITHVLKGAVYLPGFDTIPVPKGTPAHTARGLRKGMLWGTVMACAGIAVPEDVVAPELPQHLAAMVLVCAAQVRDYLTDKDKDAIAAIFKKHAGPGVLFVQAPPLALDASMIAVVPLFEAAPVKALVCK